MQKVIRISTINDKISDFRRLFEIRSQVDGWFEDVRFDFTECQFLRSNAVAFLGGLARSVESKSGSVVFDCNTLQNEAVITNLRQNGFAGNFGECSPGWDGNSIQYREDTHLEMNSIMDYLTYNWIGKGWIHVSHELCDAIVGQMWEIYNNAFEHGNSPIGVVSCGQHFPKQKTLILSVIDFGIGIASNVRNFLRHKVHEEDRVSRLSGGKCLEWAFKEGNTTCMSEIPRGLGLDFLKRFVRLNQGKLEVYSNDGYVIIDKDRECYSTLDFSFNGTVIHITLQCDEKLYRFYNESV